MFDSPQVNDLVALLVSLQDLSEHGTAGTEDNLVSLDLPEVITDQGHIRKLNSGQQLPEHLSSVAGKCAPRQVELLARHYYERLTQTDLALSDLN